MQATSEEELEAKIPEQYLPMIIRYLKGFDNSTVDFSKPILNPHFDGIYPLVIAFYALLIIASLLANFSMVYHIVRHGMHKDTSCALLINIAVSNVIHVGAVLPVTLAVMLMQNWIFGRFICFCLPMMQDIPIHISMMTYLLIVGDRCRILNDPRKPRIPAFVCSLGTWFFAVCIVLPYPIYATYLDFQSFIETDHSKPPIRGLQMCIANLADDIQEYMRSLFVGTYIAPLTIAAYLFVKSGQIIQSQEGPLAVAVFEPRTKSSTSYSRQNSNASNDIALTIHGKRESESIGTSGTVAFSNLPTSYDLDDFEIDVPKEKRTQKYLVFMVSAFAVCLCPLMVMRLARSALEETYENSRHFSMIYVVFVWVGFLPSLLTPCLYASWHMSRPAKERLRGYFRFSNRRPPGVSQDRQRSPAVGLRQHSHLSTNDLPRSRADSSISGDDSITAVAIGVSNCPRSPRTVNTPFDCSDISNEGYNYFC